MKPQTLPTKRRPVTKGVIRKLSAVTRGRRRKQRAATTANTRDFDDEQNSARIGRALFVILLIHLLAVAMIIVHHRFLSDRPAEEASAPTQDVKAQAPSAVEPEAAPETGVVRSQLSPDETPYIVGRGETYSTIAAAHNISEKDLRELNKDASIRPGYLLKIPVKRVVIKATRPQAPALAAVLNTEESRPRPALTVPARDQGLVGAIDTRNAPRATPVQVASGDNYVVQKGDTIWRIANKHGVDQNRLMEANGISDPRKLHLGMTLRIP